MTTHSSRARRGRSAIVVFALSALLPMTSPLAHLLLSSGPALPAGSIE